MGVPQFLKEILANAGRPVNLRTYKQGILPMTATTVSAADGDSKEQRRRPLRIGVDVSSWIYKACVGFSDMLADERHLTNHGRATLAAAAAASESANNNNNNRKNQRDTDDEVELQYVTTCASYCLRKLLSLRDACECELLVVLDGATPPIKLAEVNERSRKRKEAAAQRDEPVSTTDNTDEAVQTKVRAFKRAGAGKLYPAVVTHVQTALREAEIAFLVAPYESDGQLAFLSLKGYIDLIVTEDSDLVAYGAGPILYKLSMKSSPSSDGTFSNKKNNAAPNNNGKNDDDDEPTGILLRRQDLAANSGKMNLLDFSPAMLTVVFVATGSDYCRKLKGIGLCTAVDIVRGAFLSPSKTSSKDPLTIVFEELFSRTWESSNLSSQDKREYKSSFLAALLVYRHPIVYDPVHGCCTVLGGDNAGDPELTSHQPYAKLLNSHSKRDAIGGKLIVPDKLATYMAEGWISPKTCQPRDGVEIPAYILKDLEDLIFQVNDNDAEQEMDIREELDVGDEDEDGVQEDEEMEEDLETQEF